MKNTVAKNAKYTVNGKTFKARAIVGNYVFSMCGKRHTLDEIQVHIELV